MTLKIPRLTLFVASTLMASVPAYAQTVQPVTAPSVVAAPAQVASEKPWLYEGSDVPVDKSWTFGTLPNGLRYAVKKNTVPTGQVAIRVRIDAGALHEEDDERGYAHLIEHLSFRGSTHVPDGEAKRIWQRFGVTFGSDSNAQTTATQTVYKLDLPSAKTETLDQSMKILSGMIQDPRISEAALNAERAIVLAELRESSGVQLQYSDQLREHMFQGQRLAKRPTIGTPETLQASTAAKLEAFHKRWYRPENAVVVIAGDSDPATLANLVKTYFSQWKGQGIPAPEPDFGKPAANNKVSGIIVAPTLPSIATLAYVRPWYKKNDTIAYNQQLLTNALAVQIINRRLESAARDGSSFIFAEVSQDDISRSGDVTLVGITPVGDAWEQAVKDVRAIIYDATETAPSMADISREKSLFANALRTGLDSYPFEAATKQAEDIVGAVDIRETVAAPQTVVDVFAAMDSQLTPQRLLSATKSLFAGEVTRIFLSSPKSEADANTRLSAALSAPVAANSASRLAESALKFSDLPKLSKPGSLVSSEMNKRFQIETLTFSNGTKALLYPNKAESGQIRMLVRFGRGYQAFTPKTGDMLWAGDLVLGENGVGTITRSQIDQMTIGRRIGLDFGLDSDAFQFSATTRTEDLSDQLLLIATKLEHPGWTDASVMRAKALAKSSFDSFEMSATSVLQRDLDYLIRSKDMRWKSPDPASIEKLTPKSFKAFWAPLLAQGPIEVSIFGDFDRAQAVAALEKSFGAMKPRKTPKVVPQALSLKFPNPSPVPVRLTHKGPADQVAALVAWPTGGGIDKITESRELEILASVFRDRLFEKFRAERAASYSPDMSNSWPEEFPTGGYLMAYTQVQPQDVKSFYEFADEVAKDLKANPVSADELKRAVEPIKQYIDRASSGNTFWLQYLQGGAFDPRRFASLSHLYSDFSDVTPARLQQLAQTYFRDDKAWKLVVEPEGKPVIVGQ
jgi:zinc protease